MLSAKPYLKAIELKPGEYDQNSYPFSIPAVKTFEYMSFHPDITFLIGENGSGKSTFLEAIAEVFGFGAQGGTGNFSMKDAGGQSGFDACIRVKRSYQRPSDKYFLRAESFYNVATFMDDLAEESEREGWASNFLANYKSKLASLFSTQPLLDWLESQNKE